MPLHPNENGQSITNIKFAGDPSETVYYAVGTAYVKAEEVRNFSELSSNFLRNFWLVVDATEEGKNYNI